MTDAEKAGITHVMIPSVDLPTAIKAVKIAHKAGYRSASAFHPEHLPGKGWEDEWRRLLKTFISPETAAVGETGLDHHHMTHPEGVQIEWFHRHIELAESIGYPLIVHSRKAEEAVLSELPRSPSVPVVLHCWNGGRKETEEAVSRGFYIGVGGPVTYKGNNELRNTLSRVPDHLLLAETDSPFLPPEPFRGRRNEPAYTRFVIEAIRELKGGDLSIEGMSFVLWENAMRAFLLHPLNRRADIVYRYGDSVYLNLTSRCNNRCRFCIRRHADGVGGHFLRHPSDPPESLVLSTIRALPLDGFNEIVICGFGEPTLRSDLVVKCCRELATTGSRIRLNTNGLCTSFMDDNSVEQLLALVNSVSISLNASGEAEYMRICDPAVGNAWEHLLRFIRMAKASGVETAVSAVKGSGADIHRTRALAERLGVPFKVRGS